MADLPQEKFVEFASEYSKTVEIPTEKGNQFLLCPVGIVGAGKTTVLKPLAKKLGLVRVSTDEMRKMLKERDFSYKGVRDLLFIVANSFIKQGYGIAIDTDCSRLDKKKQLEEYSTKTGLKIIWIHINPPEEFIINKFKNHEPSWLFKNPEEAIANYEARKPLHQNLDFNFTYTFDTSKPDLDDQIEEAYQIIKTTI